MLFQTENNAINKTMLRKLMTSGELEANKETISSLKPKKNKDTKPNPKNEKSKLKVSKALWFCSSLGK